MEIPAGIDDGQAFSIRGGGNVGSNGGPSGDLVIEIGVRPHPFFERNGFDVYCEIPVTFAQAALGAEIDVPTLDGKTEKFTIPEGTQTGTSFTLRSKGIPDVNSKRKGDMIITVTVETPKNLSGEQKKLLQNFSASLGEGNTGKKQGFFKKIFGS